MFHSQECIFNQRASGEINKPKQKTLCTEIFSTNYKKKQSFVLIRLIVFLGEFQIEWKLTTTYL